MWPLAFRQHSSVTREARVRGDAAAHDPPKVRLTRQTACAGGQQSCEVAVQPVRLVWGPGLLLTTRHRWGGAARHAPPPPPPPWTPPQTIGLVFLRAFGRSKILFGAFGADSFRPKISSVPLGGRGGGGLDYWAPRTRKRHQRRCHTAPDHCTGVQSVVALQDSGRVRRPPPARPPSHNFRRHRWSALLGTTSRMPR